MASRKKRNPKHDATLDRLADMLRREPMTPRRVAEVMGCCRPAAYERIQALKRRGDAVYEIHDQRSESPGPRPVAYGVTPSA